MIAGLISAISLLTLVQFFISYCQSVIAESLSHELSTDAREISGITAGTAIGDHFARLRQLLSMCPDAGKDTNLVRAVSTYFNLLSLVRNVLAWAAPEAMQWMQSERNGCSYVLAVVLDRRIAYNRMLMAQQTNQ